MKTDPRFRNLWNAPKFTSKLFSIIFDEGHCISKWGGSFRTDYADVAEELLVLAPPGTLFYITSATLPSLVTEDIITKLGISNENVTYLRRSNDRPNIFMEVRRAQHPLNSFQDLAILLPNGRTTTEETKPPKFMAFFNNRRETKDGARFLRNILTQEYTDKVVWFHSGMSAVFRADQMELLRTGKIWGVCCTDAAGMVSSVHASDFNFSNDSNDDTGLGHTGHSHCSPVEDT